MLLKVLMDFRSLQKGGKAHTPTHINKQERKPTETKITIRQQGKTFGQVQLLRIKRQLQNYFVKSRKIQKQFALMVV